MIPVTFNSAAAFLLDDLPEWGGGLSLDATIPAAFERGLSGRETRRPTGDTLRLEFNFTCIVTAAALPVLRNSLQSLNTQPVLCPLWTHGFAAGTSSPVTAAFYALFNSDGSFASIQPSASQPFSLQAFPLLVGRLAEVPDPVAVRLGTVIVQFKFIENDVYPVTPPAITNTNALTDASGGARPLLPVTPNWSASPHTAASEVDIERRNLGQLRSTADAYYEQPARRLLAQSFTLANGDDLTLLRFWLDRGGERENFWLPAAMIEANLTANVASGATSLSVDVGAALGDNTAVILHDTTNRAAVKISSVSGNTWNLAAAPGTAFVAAYTVIESLALVRFNALKLSLSYNAPGVAACAVKFIEVSAEVAALDGETAGTTMGALPTTATLYKFTITMPDNTQTWYLTSFERNLTNAGNTYVSSPVEHDEIIETATLERTSVSLKSRTFTGNPLALLVPYALEWPLMVEISEADVSGGTATNLRCYFSGEVGKCDVDGPFITAECASLSHIFDRQIPRRLYQNNCNWSLFETACGLLATNWKWSGVVTGYNAGTNTLSLGSLTSTNGATLAAHFFAAGYIQIGTGSGQQVRMVGDSTAGVLGALNIILSTPLLNAPANGTTVYLYAGCDGQPGTCNAKFANYSRFGGFPFIPVANISVLKLSSNATGGGKK